VALYESCLGFRSSQEVPAVSPVIIFGPCCVEGFTVACGVEINNSRGNSVVLLVRIRMGSWGHAQFGTLAMFPPFFFPSSPFQSWSNIFDTFFLFYSLAISLYFLRPWTRKMGFGLGFQYLLSIDPRTRKIFLLLFLLLISSFAFHDAFQTLCLV
jgi:hypothetical protein